MMHINDFEVYSGTWLGDTVSSRPAAEATRPAQYTWVAGCIIGKSIGDLCSNFNGFCRTGSLAHVSPHERKYVGDAFTSP